MIATLCAAGGVPQAALDAAIAAVASAGGAVAAVTPFDGPCALDLAIDGLNHALAREQLESATAAHRIDALVIPPGARRRALLIADMDSTMITVECIDELADYAGKKAEIAAVTEAAMRGELDFAAALRGRVEALAGLDASAIDACLRDRVRDMPGARTLVATMRAAGARAVLVSGGFTAFTAPVAARLGFDRQVANRLAVADGRLTGAVGEPIVDSATKRAVLLEEMPDPTAALAVGDGANDIPMLTAAGFGIAYHAKPAAAAAADAHVRFGDLTALLWAQGIPRADWISPA